MFALLGVTLLQPEQLIADRIPGGAGALGQWLQAIQASLSAHYATSDVVGCRSLTLGLGPEGPIDFWLAAEKEQPSVDEQAQVKELVAEVPAPVVTDGPVALALVFSVGADAPAEAQLAMPEAWRAVLHAAGKPLSVDEILTRLQADRS
jgi:hypothetical protein